MHDKLVSGDLPVAWICNLRNLLLIPPCRIQLTSNVKAQVPNLLYDWREAHLEELEEFLRAVEETGAWSPPDDLPMSIAPVL